MKVDLNLENGYCKVTKEKGDKYFTRSGYSGQVETVFMHHVKLELIQQGYDVIKKRISDDPGNLVDDRQHWIRTRKWNSKNDPKQFAIFNNSWAVQDAGEVFNKTGEYTFGVL